MALTDGLIAHYDNDMQCTVEGLRVVFRRLQTMKETIVCSVYVHISKDSKTKIEVTLIDKNSIGL